MPRRPEKGHDLAVRGPVMRGHDAGDYPALALRIPGEQQLHGLLVRGTKEVREAPRAQRRLAEKVLEALARIQDQAGTALQRAEAGAALLEDLLVSRVRHGHVRQVLLEGKAEGENQGQNNGWVDRIHGSHAGIQPQEPRNQGGYCDRAHATQNVDESENEQLQLIAVRKLPRVHAGKDDIASLCEEDKEALGDQGGAIEEVRQKGLARYQQPHQHHKQELQRVETDHN
mmetsp:Transcript_115894/g.308176  ORF Transcript_115894/g.308176 Transcript_115894/m.308176 type:complete len:229 (+) Transcript_115894:281-967(+)